MSLEGGTPRSELEELRGGEQGTLFIPAAEVIYRHKESWLYLRLSRLLRGLPQPRSGFVTQEAENTT